MLNGIGRSENDLQHPGRKNSRRISTRNFRDIIPGGLISLITTWEIIILRFKL